MFLTDDIERNGTGTFEMYHLMKERGLKPPLIFLDEGFKLTIWRPSAVPHVIPYMISEEITKYISGKITGDASVNVTEHVTDHVTDHVSWEAMGKLTNM